MYKRQYLDKIKSPKDLDELNDEQLNDLASELRYDVIETVSKTGGHLGASLGVIELTIALHKIFDAPKDKAPTPAAKLDNITTNAA